MSFAITRDHFAKYSSFPERDIRQMVILAPLLKEPLTVLLHNELRCGNKIIEVAIGWPNTGSVFVLLERRFVGLYEHNTFQYLEVNDPHYWFAQYHSKHEPIHSVCCRWVEPLTYR